MTYSIACPACGHVTAAPFLRAGAVVICASCKRSYVVDADRLTRRSAAKGGAGGEGGGEPGLLALLFPDGGAVGGSSSSSSPGAAGATAAAGPAVVDTPSSTAAPPRRRSPAPASAPPPAPPGGDAAAAPAIDPNPPRRRRTMSWSALYALAASLLLTGSLVVAMVLVALSDGSGGPGGSGMAARPAPPPPPVLDPDIPVAASERLVASAWRAVDEALPPRPAAVVLGLEGERIVTSTGSAGGASYRAALVNRTAQPITGVVVHLLLQDAAGRVFARMEQPVALVSARTPVPLGVELPADLRARMATLEWRIEHSGVLANAVTLDNVMVSSQGGGRMTMVQVRAFNPVGAPLRRVVFVLLALDEQQRCLGQWKVVRAEDVEPRHTMTFAVVTPIEGEATPARWLVIAAGEP